jgi:hypothetical protein
MGPSSVLGAHSIRNHPSRGLDHEACLAWIVHYLPGIILGPVSSVGRRHSSATVNRIQYALVCLLHGVSLSRALSSGYAGILFLCNQVFSGLPLRRLPSTAGVTQILLHWQHANLNSTLQQDLLSAFLAVRSEVSVHHTRVDRTKCG